MLADLSIRVVDKVVDQAEDKVAGKVTEEEIEDSKILRAKVMMTMMGVMATPKVIDENHLTNILRKRSFLDQ